MNNEEKNQGASAEEKPEETPEKDSQAAVESAQQEAEMKDAKTDKKEEKKRGGKKKTEADELREQLDAARTASPTRFAKGPAAAHGRGI